MSKNIKVTLVLMLVLVGFISCEKDDGLKDTQDQSLFNLKTVNPKDAESAFLSKYNNKSTQSWITPYFQYNDSIGLNNSDAQITVTPVTTGFSNSYSRMFSIEINGNIESVLYHMIPNDISSQNSFWGQAVLTDLSGNVRAAFDVEDNLYTSYYDFINHTETVNVLQNSNKSQNKAGNDDDSCLIEGDEESMVICDDEVVVTAPPNEGLSTGIIVIFVPEFFPNDGQDGGASPIPDSAPTEPTAPAGNTKQDGCTEPGKIKDDNGNCVDPPECPDGYDFDEDGNCVKDPCAEINSLLSDSAYKAKLAELNTGSNTNNAHEKGYGHGVGGLMTLLDTANDGHSISYGCVNLNLTIGFVHTHPCGANDIGVGVTTLVSSIPMPSPADINAFKRLLIRADDYGRNIQDVYMTVISCHGIFDLKYSGTRDNIRNWNMDIDLYKKYFKKNKKKPILAFKKYLNEVVNINGYNGFELYKYVKDETTNEYEAIRLDFKNNESGIDPVNDCN